MQIRPLRHSRILMPALLISAMSILLISCDSVQSSKKVTETSPAPITHTSSGLKTLPSSTYQAAETSSMSTKTQGDSLCANDKPIKGKVNKEGEKIYHEPGSQNYEKVKAIECFRTASDAEKAGYRSIKSRAMQKASDSK